MCGTQQIMCGARHSDQKRIGPPVRGTADASSAEDLGWMLKRRKSRRHYLDKRAWG